MGKKIMILFFLNCSCMVERERGTDNYLDSSQDKNISGFTRPKGIFHRVVSALAYYTIFDSISNTPQVEGNLFYENFRKDNDTVEFFDLFQRADGNFIIAGAIGNISSTNGYLVEYDNSPSIVSSYYWSTGGNDTGLSLAVDSQGNIFTSGDSDGLGSGNSDMVFFKLDSSYNFLCGQSAGTSGDTFNLRLKATSNGRYITLSATDDEGINSLVILFDSDCNFIWGRGYRFSGVSNLTVNDITETSYGYALVGHGTFSGNDAIMVFNIDSLGNELNTSVVFTTNPMLSLESASIVADDSDNLYFSGGYFDGFDILNSFQKFFSKLNPDLSLDFFRVLGTTAADGISGMKETVCQDGTIVVVGQTSFGSSEINRPSILRFSPEGIVLASAVFPEVDGLSTIEVNSVIETDIGNIAIAGWEEADSDFMRGIFAIADGNGHIDNCTSNFTVDNANSTNLFSVSSVTFNVTEYNISIISPLTFTDDGFETLTSENICFSTCEPTASPTNSPTEPPSLAPTSPPSVSPSLAPTVPPTFSPRCERCLEVEALSNGTNSSTLSFILTTNAEDFYCFGNASEKSIKLNLPVCDLDMILTIEQNCGSQTMDNDLCPNNTLINSSSFQNFSILVDDCLASPIVLNISLTNSIVIPGGTLILGDGTLGCETCTDIPQLACRPKFICECLAARPYKNDVVTGIEYIFEQTDECFDEQTVKHLNIDLPECLSTSDLVVTSDCILADINTEIVCESNATSNGDYSNPASISLSGCPQDIFYLNITTSNYLIGFANDTLTSIQQSSIDGTSYKACESCEDFIGFRCLTAAPTFSPTLVPTGAPTTPPTIAPTHAPTNPTEIPTPAPTSSPTLPTKSPTPAPTFSPSLAPTAAPSPLTLSPSLTPTSSPTKTPTNAPTAPPTNAPTHAPSLPTIYPTNAPTNTPTSTPTGAPTYPTLAPTSTPTNAPSVSPNPRPTPKLTQGEKAAIWVPIVLLAILALVGLLLYLRYLNLKSRKTTAALILYDITENTL